MFLRLIAKLQVWLYVQKLHLARHAAHEAAIRCVEYRNAKDDGMWESLFARFLTGKSVPRPRDAMSYSQYEGHVAASIRSGGKIAQALVKSLEIQPKGR